MRMYVVINYIIERSTDYVLQVHNYDIYYIYVHSQKELFCIHGTVTNPLRYDLRIKPVCMFKSWSLIIRVGQCEHS